MMATAPGMHGRNAAQPLYPLHREACDEQLPHGELGRHADLGEQP